MFSQWVLVKNPGEELDVQCDTVIFTSLLDTCEEGNHEFPAPGEGGTAVTEIVFDKPLKGWS